VLWVYFKIEPSILGSLHSFRENGHGCLFHDWWWKWVWILGKRKETMFGSALLFVCLVRVFLLHTFKKEKAVHTSPSNSSLVMGVNVKTKTKVNIRGGACIW
jgi:hypothetical protein